MQVGIHRVNHFIQNKQKRDILIIKSFIITIIFSMIISAGCIDIDKNRNNINDNEYQVFISLLFNFPLNANYTASFDIFINDVLEMSIRNFQNEGYSPLTLSVKPYNTTKDTIKIEVIEHYFGLSNITVSNLSNGIYFLIWFEFPDEITIDQSEKIICLA